MNPDLERLLDESAIRRVVCDYARGIDRMDWPLLESCYHEDATDERFGTRRTRSEFLEWVKPVLGAMDSTLHCIGQSRIELQGDVAWVETHCIGRHWGLLGDSESPSDWYSNLRYCDRFERRDRTWRIARRICAYEPGNIDPTTAGALSDSRRASTRDASDPSYRRD